MVDIGFAQEVSPEISNKVSNSQALIAKTLMEIGELRTRYITEENRLLSLVAATEAERSAAVSEAVQAAGGVLAEQTWQYRLEDNTVVRTA